MDTYPFSLRKLRVLKVCLPAGRQGIRLSVPFSPSAHCDTASEGRGEDWEKRGLPSGLPVFYHLRFSDIILIKPMDTIEHFSDFLAKIGAPNFLAIGIVIVVLWLLISGLRKGLKRGGHNKGHQDHDELSGEE
jgi:hypothetical protein